MREIYTPRDVQLGNDSVWESLTRPQLEKFRTLPQFPEDSLVTRRAIQ